VATSWTGFPCPVDRLPAHQAAHSEVPWQSMGGLGKWLAHACFDVDLDIPSWASWRTTFRPSSGVRESVNGPLSVVMTERHAHLRPDLCTSGPTSGA